MREDKTAVRDVFEELDAARDTYESKPAVNRLAGSLLSKVSIAVLATAALSFASVLILTLNSSRSIVLSQFSDDAVAITELLAANVTGGVRWSKPAVVAGAYSATVNAEHSNVGALIVFDKAGGMMSAHRPGLMEQLGLRADIDRFIAARPKAPVSKMTGDHLLVVSPTGFNKEGTAYGHIAIAWQTDALDTKLNSNRNRSFIYVAISLSLLVGMLIWLLKSQITGPLGSITRSIGQIADGADNVDIGNFRRRDEIGRISEALRVLNQNEQERRRLTKAQLEAARQAEEQQRKSLAILQAAEVSADNIQSVATATEELTSSIQEIGRQTTESSNISSQAVASAEGAKSHVTQLVDNAQKIGEVVNLISDIAEQTNLLALNATIEAARAGETGKGFAVVANEVKSLARQTAKATDEISSQIDSMQSVTSGTATAIEEIVGNINRVDEVINTIASAMEEHNAATAEISQSVQQAAAGAQEITANVQNVKNAQNAADQSAAGSQAGERLPPLKPMSAQPWFEGEDQMRLAGGEFPPSFKSA